MAYPRKIRNYNAFVDGIGYFGIVTEGSLPEVKLKTEAHRGAGMDGPVAQDMGTEALQSSLTFAEWKPEILKMIGTRQRFVMRPAAMGEDDFVANTYIATMGGRITSNDVGNALKPGEDAPMKVMMEVDYYRLEKDGDVLFEIDVRNGKRTVGGVDQMADMRRAMGF